MKARYLSCKEAAEFTSIACRTLERWRYDGFGPNYIKAGKAIRYDIVDLIKFMRENRVNLNKLMSTEGRLY